MNFSTAIVTVPKRLPFAYGLAQTLKAQIVMDSLGNGSWWGHKQAMLHYKKEYHLILEDDVSLCCDFIKGVDQICGLFPDHPVSLFNMATFRSLNVNAMRLQVHFLGTNGATGQAQLWPTKTLLSFIRWCDAHIPENIPYEDTRLWLWLNTTQTPLYLACPNLVEHLLPDASTLGFKGKNRQSADFLGPLSASLTPWANNLEIAKKSYFPRYDYSTFWKKHGFSS